MVVAAYLIIASLACRSGPTPAQQATAPLDGRGIYERDCVACHMAGGRGVPGMTPSLVASSWVTGGADGLIGYVLTGGFGSQALMESFDFLTDAEMAAVLSYIRQAFGGGAGAIEPERVGRVRAQIAASR